MCSRAFWLLNLQSADKLTQAYVNARNTALNSQS